MTWTKKHDEFLQACNISGCAEYLTRYQLRRAKLNEPTEIELDLRSFNRWIGKHRVEGKYHRKTLATAIARLDERSNGMITIIKRYSPWIYKVLVRPLSFLAKIESAKCADCPKVPTQNPMFDADHKKRLDQQQQQNISKIDSLFNQIGLKYDHDALNRIWRLANKKIDNVVKAIELLLYRHSSKAIGKPHGFIIDCLKRGWAIGLDLYYEPELPRFNCKAELEQFSNSLREKIRPKYGGDNVYE